jgi:hypothetical protein
MQQLVSRVLARIRLERAARSEAQALADQYRSAASAMAHKAWAHERDEPDTDRFWSAVTRHLQGDRVDLS